MFYVFHGMRFRYISSSWGLYDFQLVFHCQLYSYLAPFDGPHNYDFIFVFHRNRVCIRDIVTYLRKKLSYRRQTRATLCIIWNVVLLLYE